MDCKGKSKDCKDKGQNSGGSGYASPDNRDVIINNPAFKKWFSKSKMKASDGKAIIVYRGEREGKIPNIYWQGKSICFSDNPAIGQLYADKGNNIYSGDDKPKEQKARAFLLRANKIIDLRKLKEIKNRKITKFLNNVKWNVPNWYKKANPTIDDDSLFDKLVDEGLFNAISGGMVWHEFIELVKEAGYEGLIAPDDNEGLKGNTFVVFEPNQIKSADNCGNFDENDLDIFN